MSNGSGKPGASSSGFKVNSDLATTVATTASVLVNSGGVPGQSALFSNATFQKAMGETLAEEAKSRTMLKKYTNEVRLTLLTRRHRETVKLRRRAMKRKDFSVLSEDMLHSIPTDTDGDGYNHDQSKGHSHDDDNEWNEESSLPTVTLEDTKYSLFQGFTATIPDIDERLKKFTEGSGRLLEFNDAENESLVTSSPLRNGGNSSLLPDITEEKIRTSQSASQLNRFKEDINYRLDLIEIRKGLSSNEIDEIDRKIDRLYKQRKLVFDRIAAFERNQTVMEDHLSQIDSRLQVVKDIEPRGARKSSISSTVSSSSTALADAVDRLNINSDDETVYSPKTSAASSPTPEVRTSRKHKATLQRYYKPGDEIHSLRAHDAAVTCFGFDQPFGTLVTASQDNTVRVWDMSRYRCVGLLEGHFSNVTCMDMQDNLVLTGSLDATLKLWDVSKVGTSELDDSGDPVSPLIQSFESHVEEVTALCMHKNTIVSGSADKTIRQWDMNTGRCMQTIDVLWATSSMLNASSSLIGENSSSVLPGLGSWDDVKHPFIGALQCYDAALASGGSDGIVRLWDLRSGEVMRQLIGHTGPVSCLQFDEKSLITGSADRSVRIWDLRTGGIVDSFAYDSPITSLQFDYNRIVCTNRENTVKIYDRTDEKHQQFGAGVKDKDASIVNYARYKEGYMVEGREDGTIGVWAV
ncbi:DEKNAAC102270 [Brettanomyces naardenensis]|uniref:DEKNAAC102270 n=1 Tax=Brettanomyces naardenensis TaxID=13370 RepID=A0A448YL63_BRENA|nr:DEKNAAC102270 [Brettanomyces naardenensis]